MKLNVAELHIIVLRMLLTVIAIFSIFHFSRVFHPSFEAISLRSNPCVKNDKTFEA